MCVGMSIYNLVKPVQDVVLYSVKIDHSLYQEGDVLGSTSKSCTLIFGRVYAEIVLFRRCSPFLEQIGKNIFFVALTFRPSPMVKVHIYGHKDLS